MFTQQFIREHGLNALKDQLGIGIREENDLVCLDYSQIASPKFHPVVQECRGLILSKGTWDIVHRPMTRFYNYTEEPFVRAVFPQDDVPADGILDEGLKPTDAITIQTKPASDIANNKEREIVASAESLESSDSPTPSVANNNSNKITYKRVAYCCDKIDGSLIKIFHHNGIWNIATRATVIANNYPNDSPFTFSQLVYKAIGVEDNTAFQEKANVSLNPHISYNCEVTSIENRIVTKYDGYTLYFLSARYRSTGDYVLWEQNPENDQFYANITQFGMKPLPRLIFPTETACIEYINGFTDLSEGLVAFSPYGVPLFKYKSPYYVKVHHIRDFQRPKSLTARDLVLSQEYDEFLGYFPEDKDFFTPWIIGYEAIFKYMDSCFDSIKDISDRRDLVNAISTLTDSHKAKDEGANSPSCPSISKFLFDKYNGRLKGEEKSFRVMFHAANDSFKCTLLEYFALQHGAVINHRI